MIALLERLAGHPYRPVERVPSGSTEMQDLVEECMKRETSKTLHNASFESGIFIARCLLRVAGDKKEEVLIASYNLQNEFYTPLVPDINECMGKGSPIDLVVLNPEIDLSKNSFAQAVRGHGYEITQAKIKTEWVDNSSEIILVGRGHLYNKHRFHMEKEKAAIANFNDPRLGTVLFNAHAILKGFARRTS